MILFNDNILDEIKKPNNHIIEISGLPDAGSSVASIFILNKLNGIGAYFGSQRQARTLELFKRVLSNENKKRIVFYLFDDFNSIERILEDVSTIGKNADYIIIDDIAYFILHKPKNYIKSFFSKLYSRTLEDNFKILIINQLRYDLNNQKENNKGANSSYRILYADYLQPYIDLRLNVKRSEIIQEDIEIEINKQYNKKKYRASSLVQSLKESLTNPF